MTRLSKDDSPGTPISIYFVSLWSFIRAGLPVIALFGQYIINRSYSSQFSGSGIPGLPLTSSHTFLSWLTQPIVINYITLLLSIAFLVTGIGFLFGQNWARLGFLVVSAILVIWNIRVVFSGHYSIPFYSLVALGIGYWYFRQPKVLQFFNAIDNSPALLNKRVLNLSLDLAISLGIFLVLAILEILGLILMFIH